MMMETTHYLPDEVLNFRNYPEVGQQWENIQALLQYNLTIQKALSDYNAGILDKVDVNENELQKYIAMCRSMLAVLGTAPMVCFDVVMEFRELQYRMQELLFARMRFGTQYVGTPSTTTTGEGL